MSKLPEVPDTVGTKEAAKLLGCSTDTIYAYVKIKKLRSTQPGSTGKHKHGGAPHRFLRADVLRLLPQPLDEVTDV